MNIITTRTESAIPSHKYCAYEEDMEDGPCGFGATKQDAIDDLNEQLEEAKEDKAFEPEEL